MMEKHLKLRQQARDLGLALLIYWVILHLAVVLLPNDTGWGYLLALALSFLCYTRWKTPAEFQQMLRMQEKTMTVFCFLGLLCLVIGSQLVAQISALCLRLLVSTLHLPMTELVGQIPVDALKPAMFLYACVLGPVAEELLFRGLLLRTLAPFGRKLAVIVSALLFGLFHGNFLQMPYAFVLGLVLGYYALQYRLVWPMLLHVGSNSLFVCLHRLLADLPGSAQVFWNWTLILVTAYLGACLLASKAVCIREWLRENAIAPGQLRAIFSTGTILAFLILTLVDMIF